MPVAETDSRPVPKAFQFNVSEVENLRRGDEVVLLRIPTNLSEAFDLLAGLPEDFMAEGRNDTPPQMREGATSATTRASLSGCRN